MNNQFEQLSTEEKIFINSEIEKNKKSPVIAWLMWWFLGTLGGHRYYLDKNDSALAMTLITILTLGIGTIVTGIWALIDAFKLNGWLAEDREKVEKTAIERLLAEKKRAQQSNQSNDLVADEIRKLKDLLDSGVITKYEFETKKDELLNR